MLVLWCEVVMGLDLDPTTYGCESLGKSCDFLSLSLLICIMRSLRKVTKGADMKKQLFFSLRPLSVSLGVHVMQLADKPVK